MGMGTEGKHAKKRAHKESRQKRPRHSRNLHVKLKGPGTEGMYATKPRHIKNLDRDGPDTQGICTSQA